MDTYIIITAVIAFLTYHLGSNVRRHVMENDSQKIEMERLIRDAEERLRRDNVFINRLIDDRINDTHDRIDDELREINQRIDFLVTQYGSSEETCAACTCCQTTK